MKNSKIFTVVLLLLLAVSMLVTACSGGQAPASSSEPASSAPAGIEPSGTEPAEAGKVECHISDDNKVVTLNGELKAMETPVLLTSVGQSADVSMLDALLKKIGAEYTFNTTAKADDMGGAKTIIIATGASSKGLGAAGISADEEKARGKELLQACKDNEVTVIMAHLGGTSRRGKLSDEFSDMVLEYASGIIMVEDGNDDGKFSDFAKEKNIPITLVNKIADCIDPLKTMFGK